jgi:leader peptidase (prepilin peptidase) / N-methyltransferase
MSDDLRVIIAALAAVPAAWVSLVLAERIPDAQPLLRPFPRVPFPRGLSLGEGFVYPLTAGLFVLAALRFESGHLAAYLAMFTVLIALSVIDMQTLRLPDRLVFPSIVATLVLLVGVSVVEGDPDQLTTALIGGFVYFAILLVAHLVYPPGMGFGDVKMSFLMGLYLGWPATGAVEVFVLVMWAMLAGFGGGSIIGIAVLVVRGRSTPYPFGPFLALGAVAVMLGSEGLLPNASDLRF